MDLLKKFQLKPDRTLALFNEPAEQTDLLRTSLAGILLTSAPTEPCDAVLLYVHTEAELRAHFGTVLPFLKTGGMLWIAYPKRGKGIETDLTRDRGWAIVTEHWTGARQIAIDETWSALRFAPRQSEADQLAAQYEKKPDMRPIYDALQARIMGLGDDINMGIRKKYVAFARSKQFCQVHASTKTRIDILLTLKGTPPSGILQDAGRLTDGALTHKIVLSPKDHLTDELIHWLTLAYNFRA
jgi:hypothetical protein